LEGHGIEHAGATLVLGEGLVIHSVDSHMRNWRTYRPNRTPTRAAVSTTDTALAESLRAPMLVGN
jgi:hypothetical protein